MKKLIGLTVAAAMLSGASLAVLADNGSAAEKSCKAMAQKKHVSADKMDEYVKACVEKHTKKAAAGAHASPAPAPATPAAPAD